MKQLRIQMALVAMFVTAALFAPLAQARKGDFGACPEGLSRPDYLECLFRKGMREKRARRNRRAIALFRRILAIEPGLPRVRLELAESYFRIGNDAQAERHFRYALGSRLPPRVVRRVQAYLDAMRRRKNWSASLDFSLAPQSNVNKATSARVITAGGVPWRLTRDSRKKAGMEVNAAASLLYRPWLSEDVRGHLRFTPSFSATTDGDFNLFALRADDLSFASWSLTLGGEAGLVFLADGREISAGLSFGHTWYEGDSYYWSYGLWLRGLKEMDARTRLAWAFSAERLDYAAKWTTKDGWSFSATPALRRQLTPALALTLRAPLTWFRVRPKDKAYIAGGLSLGLDAILPKDFSLYAGVLVSRARYRAPDRVFARRRKDWKLRATARLTWAKWKAFDLAPYLEYSYERRDSTLRLYDYDNHAIMLGLTKTF